MSFPFGVVFASLLATASPNSANPTPAVSHLPPQQLAQMNQVQPEQVPLMEPATLKSLLAMHARLVVVDVRTPEEYAQAHIVGAVAMPLDTLPAHFAELPKDVKLVVYCRSGKRSAQAVTFLLAHGYSRAVSLHGGFLAWTAAP